MQELIEKFGEIETDVLRERFRYDCGWRIEVYQKADGGLAWFAIEYGSCQPLEAGERHLAYLRCDRDIAAVFNYDRTDPDGREMTDAELVDLLFDGGDFDQLLDHLRDEFELELRQTMIDECYRAEREQFVAEMAAKMDTED